MELQALRLPGAVELCETSAKQSSGGDVHGALHGASRPAEDKLSYPVGRIIILSEDSPDIG